jgi:hypothetical protein
MFKFKHENSQAVDLRLLRDRCRAYGGCKIVIEHDQAWFPDYCKRACRINMIEELLKVFNVTNSKSDREGY